MLGKGTVTDCLSLNFAETALIYGDCESSKEFICKRPADSEVIHFVSKVTKWLLILLVLAVIIVVILVTYYKLRKSKDLVEPVPDNKNNASTANVSLEITGMQGIHVKTKSDFTPLNDLASASDKKENHQVAMNSNEDPF